MNVTRLHSPLLGLAGSKISLVCRNAALCIALAGMLGSAACTGLSGQSSSKGSGGATQPPTSSPPTTSQPATSQISASTTQVSFGNVAVGTATSQIVSLTNVGNADITIAGLSVSGSG